MRRRVIWFPERGIDKTLPKVVGETCDRAFDADDLSVYNEKTFGTRKALKTVDSVNYSSVYGMQKYQRGLAVAGTAGLFLDGVSIYSTTYSSFVWMAAWNNILFVSDGSSWKKVYLDNTAYTIGIASYVPTVVGGLYTDLYSTYGTAAWDGTNTLTDIGTTFETDVVVGDHIQIGSQNDATWALGTVTSITSDLVLVISIDDDCTAPAAADYDYWISSHRWLTKTTYDLYGVIPAVYYKFRYHRTGDGTRSNTWNHKNGVTGAAYDDKPPYLVGGKHVSSIPSTCTDSEVDYIEIFRLDTSVQTSDLYRLVGTVTLGTTSFDDEVEITDLLTALDDDLKYPCPSVLKGLLVYASRLWGYVDNKVYYSEAYQTTSQFEYFGAAGLNFFDFPDTVQAIIDYGRTLIVFLERETWTLEGLDPASMNQRRLNEDIGTYGALSAVRYGGSVFTVSSDMRLWQISGPAWQELQQVTSVLPSSPTYVQLTGSDGSLWITTGSQVVRYSLTNHDVWIYGMSGYVTSGSHKTYLGQAGRVYEIDSTGGSETVPASFIESPDLFIGTDVGLRGKFNRLLFRANCTSGTITIYVDGSIWKEITFSTQGEQTVVKHFWPVQGYYVKVRISSSSSLVLSGPIILNPW